MSNDIQFVEVDSQAIQNQLINDFENAIGETLYPGDERRIFLLQLLQVIVGLKNDINESAKYNLLKYSTGDKLDALGEFYNTPRLAAQKASVTLRFTLSAVQAVDITIPAGTRATPDGQLYFLTNKVLTIIAGQTTGDVTAEASEGGEKYNDFASGQIRALVDPMPYVASVSNIDASSGGSNVEDDNNYRGRIRLAPESFSVAGPEGAYIYWAKTADVNIADISVTSPSPGTVKVTVLMKEGGLPTQACLDAVTAAVSAKDRRPLTDNVTVSAPVQVSFNITLTYYIAKERQTEESSIRNAIELSGGAIDQYKAWQYAKLGRAINPDYLRQLMLSAGAFRIDITDPVYTALNADQAAKVGVVTINYGGLI
jgi:phage-related baseplate assembly protein